MLLLAVIFYYLFQAWVSYEPQALIANNKVHWIQTSRENNWFPTATELKKKIKSIKSKKNDINNKLPQTIHLEQYVKI